MTYFPDSVIDYLEKYEDEYYVQLYIDRSVKFPRLIANVFFELNVIQAINVGLNLNKTKFYGFDLDFTDTTQIIEDKFFIAKLDIYF